MKRLIVNADDFGYTRGVNAGIVRAFRDGIVTSATIMANADAFADAAACAHANPRLGVGCHLVLIGGKCVAPPGKINSLVDLEGFLPSSWPVLLSKLSTGSALGEQMEMELRAQVERVLAAGIQPTHFDSHKHTHAHPKVLKAVVKVAQEFGIQRIRKPFEEAKSLIWPAFGGRWRSWKQRSAALLAAVNSSHFRKFACSQGMLTPDHFVGVAATGKLNRQAILSIIEALPDGTTELMCHPGHYDEDLEASATRLKHERAAELAGLVDPQVRLAVRERNISLISFRDLNGQELHERKV